MKNNEQNVGMVNVSKLDLLFVNLELKKMIKNNPNVEAVITELTDKYIKRFGKQEGIFISNHLLNSLFNRGYLTKQKYDELYTELLIIENLNH